VISACVVLSFAACGGPKAEVNPELDLVMPKKIVWAWERPEDLRFLDAQKFGVAFLAQTIFLEKDRVILKPRKQPLAIADGAYVIAVTRIETNKVTADKPVLDDEMCSRTVSLITSTIDLPNVKAIQIDFDAVVSERAFYRKLMFDLRHELDRADDENSNSDTHHYLTMTSLASWCTGDAWFNDFPVDETVPMAFVMGADSEKIRTYLRNGNDWLEPLCRGSYGISTDEPQLQNLKEPRRIYYFKNSPWTTDDLTKVQ